MAKEGNLAGSDGVRKPADNRADVSARGNCGTDGPRTPNFENPKAPSRSLKPTLLIPYRMPKHPKGFGGSRMYTFEPPILYPEAALRGAFSGQHPI